MILNKVIKKTKKNHDADSILLKKNIFGSAGVKVISLLLNLMTTPVYMTYFHNYEILGVWFTAISVLSWILTCDMGIGNGLRNKIVKAIANNDKVAEKKYISSAYLFLFFIAFIIAILIVCFTRFINWNTIFNISSDVLSNDSLNVAIQILLLAILLQFVLRLITSLLFALQKAFVPGLLTLITNAVMLFAVLILNAIGHKNDFTILAWIYLFAVNAPLLVTTVIMFRGELADVRPSIKCYNNKYAIATLKLGGLFLWLQLMALLLNNTNNYLIALFVNNSAVVEFQIYNRVFTLASSTIAMLLTPIWSAVTKSYSEGNGKWLKKLYKNMKVIGIFAMLSQFVLIVPLQFIFNIWLGSKTIEVNWFNAFVFAIFGSVLIWSTVITNFVNGLGKLKTQMVYLTLGAIINIPLSYVLSKFTESYIAIVIANIVSYVPYCIIQTIVLNRQIRKIAIKKPIQKVSIKE